MRSSGRLRRRVDRGTLGGGFGFEGSGGEGIDGGALFGENIEGAVGGDVVAVEEVGEVGAEIAYHAAGEVAAVGEDVETDAEAVDDIARVADGTALSAARSDLALGGGADVDAAASMGWTTRLTSAVSRPWGVPEAGMTCRR